MLKEDTVSTSNPFRIVTKILLDITNDEEEYARLYDEIKGQGNCQTNKEEREKARQRERQYLLGLLNQDSTETITQL